MIIFVEVVKNNCDLLFSTFFLMNKYFKDVKINQQQHKERYGRHRRFGLRISLSKLHCGRHRGFGLKCFLSKLHCGHHRGFALRNT